jgi:hypothetical protein
MCVLKSQGGAVQDLQDRPQALRRQQVLHL